MAEPLIDLLAALPEAAPDPGRAERLRGRCHARLARQAARRAPAREPRASSPATSAWRPLVALLGLAYVVDVIVIALRIYGTP